MNFYFIEGSYLIFNSLGIEIMFINMLSEGLLVRQSSKYIHMLFVHLFECIFILLWVWSTNALYLVFKSNKLLDNFIVKLRVLESFSLFETLIGYRMS